MGTIFHNSEILYTFFAKIMTLTTFDSGVERVIYMYSTFGNNKCNLNYTVLGKLVKMNIFYIEPITEGVRKKISLMYKFVMQYFQSLIS